MISPDAQHNMKGMLSAQHWTKAGAQHTVGPIQRIAFSRNPIECNADFTQHSLSKGDLTQNTICQMQNSTFSHHN